MRFLRVRVAHARDAPNRRLAWTRRAAKRTEIEGRGVKMGPSYGCSVWCFSWGMVGRRKSGSPHTLVFPILGGY